MFSPKFRIIVLTVFLLGISGHASAEDATQAGLLTAPYPTINNIGIEWRITGDDNLNSHVTVNYRAAGEDMWREGMPLQRIPADKSIGTSPIFHWDNKHAGSIFNLNPDTEYEIKLTLIDPDGGNTEKTVTVRTRAVPVAMTDAPVKDVTPGTFTDFAATAQPGDILSLAPGDYGNGIAQRDGKAGQCIVIRAARKDSDGACVFSSFSLKNRKHVILEGVTVNGRVDLKGAEESAVVRCTVNAVYGITADSPPGAKNCYIADNVVTWTVAWKAENMGASGSNKGEGIRITGSGNVICYNRVSGYRDCISTMEDEYAADQICIDIHNNDVYVGADDGIEADFCMSNCRTYCNRITNCFMGISSQPSLGGPTYFVRNVMYNIIDEPFKLARYSKGDVVLHNTVVKVGDGFRVCHNPSRVFFRNNLVIGGEGGKTFGDYSSGDGRTVEFPDADSTCDLDYDGVGTHGTEFLARIARIKVYSFEDFIEQTNEKHATLVDMSVFNDRVEFPNPAIPEREPADLRLKAGSVATDRGQVIPGINDNYTGEKPDLGAYELGHTIPHYGPRP